MLKCPVTYRDSRGEVETVLEIEGRTIRMELRGTAFAGDDFDQLEPVDALPDDVGKHFVFASGALCGCRLEWAMPVAILVGGQEVEGRLRAELDLGAPRPDGGIAHEHLLLRLEGLGGTSSSESPAGWFEDALAGLQRLLPNGAMLKICFSCAHSDYSPAGHSLWGGLACFRDNKSGYAAVRSKEEIFRVWPSLTEFVAETHVCPEFEVRIVGTGYRG